MTSFSIARRKSLLKRDIASPAGFPASLAYHISHELKIAVYICGDASITSVIAYSLFVGGDAIGLL
jgi:hypothetical protein